MNTYAVQINEIIEKHGFPPIGPGTSDFYKPLLEFLQYLDEKLEKTLEGIAQ